MGTEVNKSKWGAKELGVLWSRVKNGTSESYLVGSINLKSLGFDKDVPLVIFSNKSKEKEQHPDLRIYLSEKKPATPAAPAAPTAPATPAKKRPAPAAIAAAQTVSDDTPVF